MLRKSTRKNKRFMVTILGPETRRAGLTYHFGSLNSDGVGVAYVDHGDKERRRRYRARAKGIGHLDKISPNSLSYFILWGDSTDLATNVRAYERRFGVQLL